MRHDPQDDDPDLRRTWANAPTVPAMAAAIGTATIRSQSRKLAGPRFGFDLRIGLTDDEPEFDRKENLESSWNDRKPDPLAAMGLSEKYLSLESNDCLRPHVREVLLLRLDDLLRLLNAPGDWGYGTKLGELTNLLLIARDDLRENRS